MADILQTSLSALLSSQRALATTGHNIANVNTPGYSRQRVELATRVPSFFGGGSFGTGVQVVNVTRSYDAFLAGGLRDSQSAFNRLNMLYSLSANVDGLLSDDNAGIGPSLQDFFNAAQEVSNDPSSLTTRQAFLGEAEGIADRFRSLAGRLDDIESQMSARLQQEVDEIQGLAQSIAELNEQIIGSTIGTAQPNDFLDERDRLIDELSTKIDLRTNVQDDGSINVVVGSGQTLVTGREVSQLSVGSDPVNPTRLNVFLDTGVGQTDLSNGISGGTIGGIMDFRREVLDPARNEVGRIALAFVDAVNTQQSLGMDLDGELGAPMFGIAEPTLVPALTNTGAGSINAAVTDVSALTGDDYTLRFDGANYTLTRGQTGEVVPMTGTGTAGDPFVAEGVSFEVAGTPASGDSYLIRPTYNAASTISLVMNSPRDVAAAAPLRTATGDSNIGTASLSLEAITDPTNPALQSTTTIEFLTPTTYSINGAGSFTYTDGQPIDINGAQVSISGIPAAGDTFTLEPNDGGVGDNSNMLQLAGLANVGILDGGSSSLVDGAGQLLAEVGSATRLASNNLTAQGVLLDEAINQRDSVSGVNLDEEAANMLRYQQAYEAAAQMITVADSLFSTVLNAVAR